MSAVSNSVMPSSRLRCTIARVCSASLRIPKLLQPSPTAETLRPELPRLRYSTTVSGANAFFKERIRFLGRKEDQRPRFDTLARGRVVRTGRIFKSRVSGEAGAMLIGIVAFG